MEVPVEHRDVLHRMFQGKSKSVEFCEQRLMEARRLLQYIGQQQVDPWNLTPWQAATLVQTHAKGKKEKATRMRSAMRWLEYISGAQFRQDQQLVHDQIQSRHRKM